MATNLEKALEFIRTNAPTGVAIVQDGGCTNNQLPEAARTMYGSFAVFLDGKRIEKITHNGAVAEHQYRWDCDMPLWRDATPIIPATNNVAECEMLAQALTYGVRVSASPKYKNIVFMGDSQTVEAYTKPNAKVGKDATHLAGHQEVITAAFQNNPTFTFVHMPGELVKAILGH